MQHHQSGPPRTDPAHASCNVILQHAACSNQHDPIGTVAGTLLPLVSMDQHRISYILPLNGSGFWPANLKDPTSKNLKPHLEGRSPWVATFLEQSSHQNRALREKK